MATPTMHRDDLLHLDKRELLKTLCDGFPIDPQKLDDTQYRGISLGLPAFVEALTWKVFRKTFHRDPKTSALRGWNVRLEQLGLDGPSVPMRKGTRPITFGHYEVVSARGRRMPHRCDHGLLIDYGRGQNPLFDASRFARDPLVALEQGKTNLLLGWSYLEIGPLTLSTPSFFLLELEGPLSMADSGP